MFYDLNWGKKHPNKCSMNWVMWVNYNIDHQAYLGMLSRTIFSPIRGEVYFSKLISLDIYLEEIKTLRFFEPHTHRKTKLTWDPKELDGLYMFLPFPSGLFFQVPKLRFSKGKNPHSPNSSGSFTKPRHLGSMASGLIGPATSAICSRASWWPRKAAAYL